MKIGNAASQVLQTGDVLDPECIKWAISLFLIMTISEHRSYQLFTLYRKT